MKKDIVYIMNIFDEIRTWDTLDPEEEFVLLVVQNTNLTHQQAKTIYKKYEKLSPEDKKNLNMDYLLMIYSSL